jgi:hypothetical protein
MITSKRIRNLVLVLAGILVLVLKRHYNGPLEELVYAYGSNISVSFAIYFIILLGSDYLPRTRLLAVVGSFLSVELFELTNGFGFMTNYYDPMDYLANALGITLALVVDLLLDRPGLPRDEDEELDILPDGSVD